MQKRILGVRLRNALFGNEHRLRWTDKNVSVRIFSGQVFIRAQVAALEQFSDHADTGGLIRWLQTFKKRPSTTYLVHGERSAASLLQKTITEELGWKVNIAKWLERVPLG